MKEHESKIRVIYADTDAMGIVYHTNYIKWFEIGRTELLREMGIIYSKLERNEGYYLPLTECNCHYLLPARYDDIVVVKTCIAYLRRASIRFDYAIFDEMSEKRLAEGFTVHAFTNSDSKIVRAPKYIAEKIKKMGGESRW